MRLTTLGIPLLVGLIAAGLNWYVLNQRDAPKRYLRVKDKVNAGTPLTADALEVVELSGPPDTLDQLKNTVVPAGDKGLVVGRSTTRDLQPNDLVLWRDFVSARGELKKPFLPVSLEGLSLPERLLQAGDQISFIVSRRGPPATAGGPPGELGVEEIGPFRVLSVGDLTDRRELDSKERASTANHSITIEVEYDKDKKLSPNIQKLMLARQNDSSDPRGSKVVAIVLRPRSETGK